MENDARLRVPRIIWMALFASTLMYLLIPFLIPRPAAGPEPILLWVFAVVACVCAVMSFVLPAHLFRIALRQARFEVTEKMEPRAEELYRGEASAQRLFAEPGEARDGAMARYFTPLIISLALSEAVAIYGLVLLLLGTALMQALPLYVVSWLLMAAHFPRSSIVVRALERAYEAKLEGK